MRLDPEPHQWRHEEFDHRHKSSPAEDAYLRDQELDRIAEWAGCSPWPSDVERVRAMLVKAREQKRC